MTNRELSQLYYLRREIARDEDRLRQLESQAMRVTSAPSGTPHSGTRSDRTGSYAVLIAEQQELINAKLAQARIQYRRIMRWLESVDDSFLRQVIQLRCAECMSWEAVAAHVGGGNTADGVKHAYHRYLKTCHICHTDMC